MLAGRVLAIGCSVISGVLLITAVFTAAESERVEVLIGGGFAVLTYAAIHFMIMGKIFPKVSTATEAVHL